MILRRLLVVAVCLGCLVSGFFAWEFFSHRADNDVGRVRVLPDGSNLRLEEVLFTSRGFTYSFVRGGKPVLWALSKLPLSIRKKLKISGGGVAYGGPGAGNTNLLVVTIQRQPPGPGTMKPCLWVRRLRVCDERGNRSDEFSGGPSFGPPGVTGQLWIISAFPRRSRIITLECLATNAMGGWTNVAQFRVLNPAWADPAPWTAEKLPTTHEDRGLAVTLEAFQTGWRIPAPTGAGDPSTVTRKTRLVFSFAENGKMSPDWAIKQLIFRDPTGNNWSAFPDAAYLDPGRAALEIYRPLWPGEAAWRVRAQFLRLTGFRAEDLWNIPLNLPTAGGVLRLTNEWVHNGVTLKLAVLASPHAELGPSFPSVRQGQHEETDEMYAVGLQFEGGLTDHWVNILRMTDDHGGEVKLQGGLSNFSSQKRLFFKTEVGVRSVTLTTAVPSDRIVEFVARPEPVDGMPAVRASPISPKAR